MSTSKQVLVACDTPGCTATTAQPGGDAWAARKSAGASGWTRKGTTDTCPTHSLI